MKLLNWVGSTRKSSVVEATRQCIPILPWEGSNWIGPLFVIQLRNRATLNVGGEPGGNEHSWVTGSNRNLRGCSIRHGMGSASETTIFGCGSWCCDKKRGRECWSGGFGCGWARLSPDLNLYSPQCRRDIILWYVTLFPVTVVITFSKNMQFNAHFLCLLPMQLGLLSMYANLKVLFHVSLCFILNNLCWCLILATTDFSCFSFLSDFCFFLLSSFAWSLQECLWIAASWWRQRNQWFCHLHRPSRFALVCIRWASIGSIYWWQKGSKMQTICQEQSYLWIASFDGSSVKAIISSQTRLCSWSQRKSPLHLQSIATAPPTKYSPLGQSRLASVMIWSCRAIVWCQFCGSSGRWENCPVWRSKEGAAHRRQKPWSWLVYSSLHWWIHHGKGAGLFLEQNRCQWGLVCQIGGSALVWLFFLCQRWGILAAILQFQINFQWACCCCIFNHVDDWFVYLLCPIFLLIIMFSLSLNFILAQLVRCCCFFHLMGNAHGELSEYVHICSVISCLLFDGVVGEASDAFAMTGRTVSFQFCVVCVNFNDWLLNSTKSYSSGPRTEVVSMYDWFAATNCVVSIVVCFCHC